MSFSRIAIVNRGEPAMRLINAVREYRVEHGIALRSIALYTDPDRHAAFVSEADEAYALGPARIDSEANGPVATYVHHPTVLAALGETGADAVWTGWGFVSESADFAASCEAAGLTMIGPGSATMRMLGDKIASKRLAEEAGVPIAPWSGGAVETVDDALAAAGEIGYPLLLKATAGGGGRGIRRVGSPDELRTSFEAARREAAVAFGDPTVFLESLIPGARHIEVQIVGDHRGTVWSLGIRDCSVQRRNQKLIEESPSPVLSRSEHEQVADAAVRLGCAARYQNVGTVEFLYHAGRFAFMEVNTRLQVEHPITEITTGIDLVKLQLGLAMGDALTGDPPTPSGHAIEVRLTAEDADAGFAPAPGPIEILRFPNGPGVRVDSGVEQDDEVVADYDSMVAKVIGHGASRSEAIARLRRALGQTTAVIRGGVTNKSFLQTLLEHPDFVAAEIDVGWIDRMLANGSRLRRPHRDVALITAAIAAYLEQMKAEHARFQASATRGRPDMSNDSVGRTVQLRQGGESYECHVAQVGGDSYAIEVDGKAIAVKATEVGAGRRLTVAGKSHRTLSVVHGANLHVEVDGTDHRIGFDEGGVVRAPSPSVVVSIDIRPGQTVEVGDRLAIIEAMKMETSVTAEFSGTVRDVLVHPSAHVGAGSPMIIIDLREDDPAAASDDRVGFDGLAEPVAEHRRCVHRLRDLRNAMLGYDAEIASLVADMKAVPLCTDRVGAEERSRIEDDILSLFADLLAVFGRNPPLGEGPASRRAPEDYLFDYLREVDRAGGGQPAGFLELLDAVLRHHGVNRHHVDASLWSALHRVIRVRARLNEVAPAIAAVLEDRADTVDATANDVLRSLLDRLAVETLDRMPAIHDLVTDLRYHMFEAPFLDELRERAYRQADARLAALRMSSSGTHRRELIDALVECPQPLAPMLTREIDGAAPEYASRLLEVMVRRYYRIRDLAEISARPGTTGPIVTASYHHDGRAIRLISTAVSWEMLGPHLSALKPTVEAAGPEDTVLDVYLVGVTGGEDADSIATACRRVLDDVLGHLEIRRIVVAATSSLTATSMASVAHFTFRPASEGGYVEESVPRDLHPMMADRLELWRLQNFATRRLPTLEDIYLFHGAALDNPADERLFGIAEVRDVTRVTDPSDGSVRLPELERVFNEVVAAIRRVQATRPPDRRLMWNRVLLYVWPEVEPLRDEIQQIVRRWARAAESAGLAKVVLLFRRPGDSGDSRHHVLEIAGPRGTDVVIRERDASVKPIRTLTPHEQRVVRLRQRGLFDPFDIVEALTASNGGVPPGRFQEYDLVAGSLETVDRPPGSNEANIVVGVLTTPTDRYPEGIRRVVLIGDPGRGMGNVAEPECARIIAGLDLAEALGVPLDWFAVSSGARISMESGTENMDWVARVLRRLIQYTQAGGEVNVVVTGINVGAQPYWNAEATMLMHTRGILVMTPGASMVLTGKNALDFSGGVSAEDDLGIGGYSRVMGPNGQAQYFAQDIAGACRILFDHHRFSFIAPGERVARRARTSDPFDRDIGSSPHGGDFDTIADVFSVDKNPERKHPFEIRRVMEAAIDADLPFMERWYGMQDAEVAVVWDAFLGGMPVTLLGLESKSMPRMGFVPADGPDAWTAGTLFPRASKKVARAINAASGNRPVVVLANLSGFDGSPESMRRLQLEYGAEIGRAVVNFQGPIVFCVVSRYHGGAFVVFSAALNERLEVAAVEGARASVIGGAPAAAVVFARDVSRMTDADPRVVDARRLAGAASGPERSILRAEADSIRSEVQAEYTRARAEEFDSVHDIERARRVGSVHHIIDASSIRPYLIGAVERGLGLAAPG